MSTTGRKDDQGKARWDLLPAEPIEAVVEVLTFGADKYGDWNWTEVPNGKDRYYAAAMRHIDAVWRLDEIVDKESGLPHLAHAICCLIFLSRFVDGE